MNNSEFDRFADIYRDEHAKNIKFSGESPEFFAEYKIIDLKKMIISMGIEALKILDFGSGIGNSIPHFRKLFPESMIFCADVSSRSLDLSKTRFPGNEHYIHIDGNTIPIADGSLDVVFTACVFHHIPLVEHEHWLCELNRVLRPGGLVVVYEHNPYNPITNYLVNKCPLDQDAVLISPEVMKNLFANVGFCNIKVRYRIFFPATLRFFRPLERYMEKIFYGAQYYVAAQKSHVKCD